MLRIFLKNLCMNDEQYMREALREAREETGLRKVRAVSEEICSLEVLTVDGHEKRGAYVPSHLHLNVSYLLALLIRFFVLPAREVRTSSQ